MGGIQALQVVGLTEGRLVEPAVARLIVRFAAGAEMDGEQPPIGDLRVDPSLLSLFCREAQRASQGRGCCTDQRAARAREPDQYHRGLLPGLHERRRARSAPLRRGRASDHPADTGTAAPMRMPCCDPGVTAEDIDRLVNERLLRTEDRGGARRIELSHDVLTPVARAGRDLRAEQERVRGRAGRGARAPAARTGQGTAPTPHDADRRVVVGRPGPRGHDLVGDDRGQAGERADHHRHGTDRAGGDGAPARHWLSLENAQRPAQRPRAPEIRRCGKPWTGLRRGRGRCCAGPFEAPEDARSAVPRPGLPEAERYLETAQQ